MPTSLPFHAVLWDMDGVIVDSYDGHYHAWQRIFNELGHQLTEDEFARTFGMNNRLILYTILNRKLPEDEFQAISVRKEEYFRESIRGSAQLLPGVAAWLALNENTAPEFLDPARLRDALWPDGGG